MVLPAIRPVHDSALQRCSPLVVLFALGCTPQTSPTPVQRSEFRVGTGSSSGSSTGSSSGSDSDSTSTGGGFDCEGQPAGWPANKTEILEAFSHDKFAVRQCAYDRILARICSGDMGLKAALEELADPANGYPAEVRARAQALLDAEPGTPSVGDISVDHLGSGSTLTIGLPPGWIPPESALPGDPPPTAGENYESCEVRIWDYLGGDRAEAIFQDTYGPSSGVDACGNGGGGYTTNLNLPCPAEKYEVEVICVNSAGESATATYDIPPDADCEGGSTGSTGDGSTGDTGSSSSSSSGGGSTGGSSPSGTTG